MMLVMRWNFGEAFYEPCPGKGVSMIQYTAALSAAHQVFLRDTFGERVSFAPEELRVYASDASLLRGAPLAMLLPGCVQDVLTLLCWADAERIPIYPRGRGTSLSGGCVPLPPGIVVSMLGMDAILDISTEDFVAEVEPGVTTAAFQKACERLGMIYPPDPASARASSLGGNVATCAGGLRAVKYGVTRDYVLGCDLALPGGKLLSLGRRCHKDVVGLDLTRLVVGSEGVLGIVTKLLLKLLPKPESSASLLVGYPSLEAALQAIAAVFAAGILPSALEFMNECSLDILRASGPCPWPENVNSLLLFQIDGSARTLPLELDRLAAGLKDALWSRQGFGPEQEQELWEPRRRLSAASYILGPDRIGGDMAVPRGKLLAAVRRFEDIAAANGKRLIAFGHAGDGNIHANLHYDSSDPDDAARTRRTHEELDRAVLEFNGSISGEHGGGCLKEVGAQLDPQARELMRDIRRVFDPHLIMNPGKAC